MLMLFSIIYKHTGTEFDFFNFERFTATFRVDPFCRRLERFSKNCPKFIDKFICQFSSNHFFNSIHTLISGNINMRNVFTIQSFQQACSVLVFNFFCFLGCIDFFNLKESRILVSKLKFIKKYTGYIISVTWI